LPKHKCPEFENHERWLLSYADMLTLLFAVFVVLFALKESGEKSEDAAGSLEESFNKPLEDIPPSQRVGPTDKGFGIFENMKGTSHKPPLIQKFPTVEERIKIIDDEMNLVSKQLEERLYGGEKFRKDPEPGAARIVSVERTKTGFKVRLLARHFYKQGQVEMKKSALASLDQVIKAVKGLGREVRVEGHSDSLRTGGMSNWDMSVLRASKVLQYMIAKHHYPPSKLSASGHGDSRPMASNSTEAGRAMNRRIEFEIRYDQDMGLEQK
jgi:chemotaxis protein MotB